LSSDKHINGPQLHQFQLANCMSYCHLIRSHPDNQIT